MTPRTCYTTNARDRALRASKAPGDTFHCRKCGHFKSIRGRKLSGMIGKLQVWDCAQCAGGGK